MKQGKGYEARGFVGNVEIRNDGDATKIVGMAAVFDSLSENLGGFREIIAPGAFDETNMDDVRGLFNHDENYVLGRSAAGTLQLERNSNGLKYTIDAPETRTIQDLVIAPIQRGDVSQSSFGFIVGRGNDEWEENEDGVLIRTIRKVQRLLDVSPVVFPAYPDTAAATRSLDRFREQRAAAEEAMRAEAENRRQTLARLERRTQIASRC